MVSLTHKFVFLHIPKCGGTSVYQQIKPYIGYWPPTHHLYFSEIWDKMTEEERNGFYKWTVIRNPWDRLGSFFAHISNWPNPFYHGYCKRNGIITFQDFIMNIDTIVADIYKGNITLVKSIEFLQDWLYVDGENHFDDIIEIEYLNERWPEICKLMKIEYHPLGRERSKSKDGKWKQNYTPEMKQKVELVYGSEIEEFKFKL